MMIINGSYDVAGLYLYMLVVETFSADKIKLQAYAFIGWGKYYFQLHIFSVAWLKSRPTVIFYSSLSYLKCNLRVWCANQLVKFFTLW